MSVLSSLTTAPQWVTQQGILVAFAIVAVVLLILAAVPKTGKLALWLGVILITLVILNGGVLNGRT